MNILAVINLPNITFKEDLDFNYFEYNKPRNRRERKAIEKIASPVHREMAELENIFYDQLFKTEKPYKQIYTECLNVFLALVEKYRFKGGISLDEYFFVKMYKPLENENT
jgi:hypothetical protein